MPMISDTVGISSIHGGEDVKQLRQPLGYGSRGCSIQMGFPGLHRNALEMQTDCQHRGQRGMGRGRHAVVVGRPGGGTRSVSVRLPCNPAPDFF